MNPFDFNDGSPNFFGPSPNFPGMQGPPPPPPNFTPQPPTTQFSTQFGGHSSISRCLFRHTFIWLSNGRSFWFFPISVTRNQVIGFRWFNRRGWQPSVIYRNEIFTFNCFF